MNFIITAQGSMVILHLEKEFNESLIPYRVNFSRRDRMEDYFYELIKDNLVKV